jgi:hypothetical protein
MPHCAGFEIGVGGVIRVMRAANCPPEHELHLRHRFAADIDFRAREFGIPFAFPDVPTRFPKARGAISDRTRGKNATT